MAASKVLNKGYPINDFLVDQMRRFISAFALKCSFKYSRRGPLFSEKFKRINVGSEHKLQYLLCYIHHNPIHHGFNTNYKNWVFSSYNAYLSDRKTNIKRIEMLEWIGGREIFLKIHQEFKIAKDEDLNLD